MHPTHGLDETAWRWLADAFAMPSLLATPARSLEDIAVPPSRLCGEAREKLTALLGTIREDGPERLRHAPVDDLADRLRLRAGDLSRLPDAVLHPQDEAAVLAVLRLCADMDVAVGGDGAGFEGLVALDLGALQRFATDDLAGLVEVEAGITPAELERRLAARGMKATDRHALRLATPRGLLAVDGDLAPVLARSPGGVITATTLRLRPQGLQTEQQAYLFPDFAAGLTAMRQVARGGIAHRGLRLSDAAETAFFHGLEKSHGLRAWLAARRRRDFGDKAVLLTAMFEDAASRKRFDDVARRLGATSLGRQPERLAQLHDLLLDRGAALDTATVWAGWPQLPVLCRKVRAALERAMRTQAPREGAQGLVLMQLNPASAEGAYLTVTWLYARRLDDEIAQAVAIRQAASDVLAPQKNPPQTVIRRAIRQAIDPKGIVGPR